MFLKQVANDSTGCVSYVGYCYSCKAGFVIDPLEDIEPYLQVAKIVALVLYTFSIPISKQTT